MWQSWHKQNRKFAYNIQIFDGPSTRRTKKIQILNLHHDWRVPIFDSSMFKVHSWSIKIHMRVILQLNIEWINPECCACIYCTISCVFKKIWFFFTGRAVTYPHICGYVHRNKICLVPHTNSFCMTQDFDLFTMVQIVWVIFSMGLESDAVAVTIFFLDWRVTGVLLAITLY